MTKITNKTNFKTEDSFERSYEEKFKKAISV